MRNLFYLSVLIGLTYCFESSVWYSVIKYDNTFTVIEGKQVKGCLAWGKYVDDTHNDGWGKLTLHTKSFQHCDEAYAAGFLEGALQGKYISHHKINFYDLVFNGTQIPDKLLVEFLEKQYEFTNQQIILKLDSSPYWKTVGLFMHFFEGLVQGFNDHVTNKERLTKTDFLIFQAFGDMFDIMPAVARDNQVDWFDLSKEEFRKRFLLNTHCSVLLKIKEDLSDVFLGHTTWGIGSVMLRTYKFYNFGVDMKMQFSSYPGVIYSVDDFYILQKTNQQLFITETSLGVFNKGIYKHITTDSLLCWQRTLVTNFLATDGESWTEIFKYYNSGTYNNQYMVIDTKKFILGQGALPGFFWVLEQMPGLIINKDLTDIMIGQGNYWSSYNIPYFEKIYEYAGYDKAYQKMGDEMSHDMCPRAQIFRRDQSAVQTFEAYKKILRYNKFQQDPLSEGNATMTIAARADLYPQGQELPYFAYDAKVTSYSRITNHDGLTDIQNGPSFDDQPIFKWSDFKFTQSHVGLPDSWSFDWVSIRPEQ